MTLGALLLGDGPSTMAPVDDTSVDALRRAFQIPVESNGPLMLLLAAFAVLALLLLAWRLFLWGRKAQAESRPDLFRSAVQVLQLTDSQAAWLRSVADRAGVTQPTAIFLSPANLAHALEAAALRPAETDKRTEMDELCVSLFDAPLPEAQRRLAP